jgi:hypothetical protein
VSLSLSLSLFVSLSFENEISLLPARLTNGELPAKDGATVLS